MIRGTFEQYNIQHDTDCVAVNMPPDGFIGYVEGQPAPQNQHTTKLYDPFQNPDGSDDYIWLYNDEDLINLGWVTEL